MDVEKKLVELFETADEECKHSKSCKSCSGYGKGSLCINYHFADYLIAHGVTVQEWVSVEERLPDNDWGKHWKERKYYLVITAPSGLMSVATYGYKEFGWWVDRCSQVLDEKTYRKVTHWMPLPPPPKGGEGK